MITRFRKAWTAVILTAFLCICCVACAGGTGGEINLKQVYDQYLDAPFNSSMLYTSWNHANEIDPNKFSCFYTCLVLQGIVGKGEILDEDGDMLIPQQTFEKAIFQYFDISEQILRQSDSYDEDTKMYHTSGVGGAVTCKAVNTKRADDKLTVLFVVISDDGNVITEGTLEIKYTGENQFQYVSCHVKEI